MTISCGSAIEHAVDLVVLTVTNTDVAAAADRVARAPRARAGVRAIVGRPGATLVDLQRQARDFDVPVHHERRGSPIVRAAGAPVRPTGADPPAGSWCSAGPTSCSSTGPTTPTVVQRLVARRRHRRRVRRAGLGRAGRRSSMEGLGFPGLAPLPFVGAFPEVNVRTYVRVGERVGPSGSSPLDVDRMLPALVARRWVPPRLLRRSVSPTAAVGDVVSRRRVERRWPRASAGATQHEHHRQDRRRPIDHPRSVHRASSRPAGDWSAPTRARQAAATHRIAHSPWPLHAAEVAPRRRPPHRRRRSARTPFGPPRAMWSPGVAVRRRSTPPPSQLNDTADTYSD